MLQNHVIVGALVMVNNANSSDWDNNKKYISIMIMILIMMMIIMMMI